MSYTRGQIPTNPEENIARLESIRAGMQSKVTRLEGELTRVQERMQHAENGIHLQSLKDKESRLLTELTELDGKIQWNISHVEKIRDAMAAGTYVLTHKPFAQKLAAATVDDDVHIEEE